jgi:hypothetical protein
MNKIRFETTIVKNRMMTTCLAIDISQDPPLFRAARGIAICKPNEDKTLGEMSKAIAKGRAMVELDNPFKRKSPIPTFNNKPVRHYITSLTELTPQEIEWVKHEIKLLSTPRKVEAHLPPVHTDTPISLTEPSSSN